MPSNNDFISDLAEEIRWYQKTNNQLLQMLVQNQASTTPLNRQSEITPLVQDEVSEWDIVNKINEIIIKLKQSNVTE